MAWAQETTAEPKTAESTTAPMLGAAAQAALAAARPGDVVELGEGFDPESLPRIAYRKTSFSDVQYLISDDPEYIRVPEAVALREEVEPGGVRLYVYNVNGVEEPAKMPRKIAPVIENRGTAPLTVTFQCYASPEPSGNYFAIAKAGMRGFLGDYNAMERGEGPSRPDMPAPLTIAPGAAAVLDPLSEGRVANYNDLVHGFYQFQIDQPARIHVVQTAPERPAAEAALDIAEPLPPKASESGAGRGLFRGADIAVEGPLGDPEVSTGFVTSGSNPRTVAPLDTADGPRVLIVADGKDDPWIVGTVGNVGTMGSEGSVGSAGAPAKLAGNYGVLYHIHFPLASSDGRAWAAVTWNARFGSPWCNGMAAVMLVGGIPAAPGEVFDDYFIAELPRDQLVTKSLPEVVVINVFPPVPAGETRTMSLLYTPPGASCLPTPIAFLPVDVE